MLVQENILVRIVGKNKEYYTSKGYRLPCGVNYMFEIKAKDLPENSNVKVLVKCDECNEQRITKFYRKDLPCKSCSKKGIEFTDEHKQKISENRKGKCLGKNNHWYGFKYDSPEQHPSYNHNLSDEDREKRRGKAEYREWSYNVKVNGNFTCQLCGDNRGGNLVSHHIDSYMSNKEKRYDLDNGICLCGKCHKDFHSEYGYGNNTSEQFEEFTTKRSA